MAVFCFCEQVSILLTAMDPEGGAERLITGIKIFPPAPTGAEQGINPERASRTQRMQFNKEVFWLTSP